MEHETDDLVNELKQGKELAKQLQIHLNAQTSTHGTPEYLAHQIIVSFNKVLAMLHSATSTNKDIPGRTEFLVSHQSPRSFSGSPSSEDSDHHFKDPNASRKRKAMPRWTKQIKIQPGTGIEGSHDDIYSWRKYGQKDILGAIHPRGYYRCTHRHMQGCLATKHVQRSDKDPTIFEITYRGRHTCTNQPSNFTPQPSQISEPSILTTNQNHDYQTHNQQHSSQEVLLSFKTGLKVTTDDLDPHQQINPTTFDFPTSVENNDVDNSQNYSLSHYYMMGDNNINISSPWFLSPATSSSNHNLSILPSNLSTFGGNFQNLGAWGNELTEIITTASATATSSSPTIGVNHQFGHKAEFNSNFTFDNSGYLSEF